MGYYDELRHIMEYIRQSAGIDGSALVNRLKHYLAPGLRVLELGMGEGKDLDILKRDYEVIGSDVSRAFISLYRKKHPEELLLRLDARTIITKKKFDGIYSNKVLHHLSKEEMVKSLSRQKEILTEGGMVLHSFWHGEHYKECHGLPFYYYNKRVLKELFSEDFDILELQEYEEVEKGDSLYVIARKKS